MHSYSHTIQHYNYTFIGNVRQFYNAHAGRQGISVLGFQASSVDAIESQYRKHHSKLLKDSVTEYEHAKVLEVYAYYKGDSSDSEVDTGTVLRFVEPVDGNNRAACLLPGLEPVEAQFDENSQAAYCDHWVSNGMVKCGYVGKITRGDLHSFSFCRSLSFN